MNYTDQDETLVTRHGPMICDATYKRVSPSTSIETGSSAAPPMLQGSDVLGFLLGVDTPGYTVTSYKHIVHVIIIKYMILRISICFIFGCPSLGFVM